MGSRPASAVAVANTPTSSVICIAAGNPSLASRAILDGSILIVVSNRPGLRPRSRLTIAMSSQIAMKMRESTVAHAEPSTPSTGAPSLPKIRIQFATTLITLARMSANMTGLTDPVACR